MNQEPVSPARQRAFFGTDSEHRFSAATSRATPPRVAVLYPSEARAHCDVLDVINRRRTYPGRQWRGVRTIRNTAADERFLREFDRLLEQFSPRCNCGLALTSTPLIGMVRLSCTCGWTGLVTR